MAGLFQRKPKPEDMLVPFEPVGDPTDASPGRLRHIEAVSRSRAAKSLRAGRSDTFIHVADAIDHYGRLKEGQRKAWGAINRGHIVNMRDKGELTEDDAQRLIVHLKSKYPGAILSSRKAWQETADLISAMPVQTDNDLVNAAQKYIGYDENEQKAELEFMFRNAGQYFDSVGMNPVKNAWCAGFAACALTEAGYETPTDGKQFRARDYKNYGKPSTGEVGDLAVFKGHVAIVAGVEEPKRAKDDDNLHTLDEQKKWWLLGGNQSDSVMLKKHSETNLDPERSDYFLGFRKPVKKGE